MQIRALGPFLDSLVCEACCCSQSWLPPVLLPDRPLVLSNACLASALAQYKRIDSDCNLLERTDCICHVFGCSIL